MNMAAKQHTWASFLKFYSEQNQGRSPRLGLFDRQSVGFTDHWIEDGLPLEGVDIDTRGKMPAIEIMLKDLSTRSEMSEA